jgi:predicted alpha/beta hydrolase family esterase
MSRHVTTLILPGLYSSGPDHWQSHWERQDATCLRVQQDDWEAPRCADWVERLSAVMRMMIGDFVLVAHSSSCAMVAHWARQATPDELARVHGALLVAPSDPDGPAYPEGPSGFSPVPLDRLPFRSIVVASDNDEYVTLPRAMEYASAWGSELEVLAGAGHINSASGHGPWPAGYALLDSLR